MSNDFNTLSWNVRGLNSPARCLAVHETLKSTTCHIACLQETKLQNVDNALAGFLGGYRLNSFAHKPAQGTRGGIIILWNDSTILVNDIHIGIFSLSATVTIRSSGTTFLVTVVYGPSRRHQKTAFLQHLRALKPPPDIRWLLLGDFNLIYRARDKNNQNLDLQLMRHFRAALNFCELKEIHLQNRNLTWSNERRRPTLIRLDRFFINEGWDLAFPDHTLHALSSSHSDHCPLLLAQDSGPRRPTPFKFENFWIKLPQFMHTVQAAWNAPTSNTEPFHRLGHKLHATARALRS